MDAGESHNPVTPAPGTTVATLLCAARTDAENNQLDRIAVGGVSPRWEHQSSWERPGVQTEVWTTSDAVCWSPWREVVNLAAQFPRDWFHLSYRVVSAPQMWPPARPEPNHPSVTAYGTHIIEDCHVGVVDAGDTLIVSGPNNAGIAVLAGREQLVKHMVDAGAYKMASPPWAHIPSVGPTDDSGDHLQSTWQASTGIKNGSHLTSLALPDIRAALEHISPLHAVCVGGLVRWESTMVAAAIRSADEDWSLPPDNGAQAILLATCGTPRFAHEADALRVAAARLATRLPAPVRPKIFSAMLSGAVHYPDWNYARGADLLGDLCGTSGS